MRWNVVLITLAACIFPRLAPAAEADCESCLRSFCMVDADQRTVRWAEVIELAEDGSDGATIRVIRYEGVGKFNVEVLYGARGDVFYIAGPPPGTQVGDTLLDAYYLYDYGDHLDILAHEPYLVRGDTLDCGAPVEQAVKVALDAECLESVDGGTGLYRPNSRRTWLLDGQWPRRRCGVAVALDARRCSKNALSEVQTLPAPADQASTATRRRRPSEPRVKVLMA